jgi:hypothetical protein
MTKRYELLFSDVEIGHPELGWMPRTLGDTDKEDDEYKRFLKARGIKARVYNGYAVVESTVPVAPPTSSSEILLESYNDEEDL